jgi:hypothetical protein
MSPITFPGSRGNLIETSVIAFDLAVLRAHLEE